MGMEQLYYTIRQVSDTLGEQPHVIRYWEKSFSVVRPAKTRSGQRRYRAQDLVMLQRIRRMLREEGLTVDGVRRRLETRRRMAEQADTIAAARRDLEEALHILNGQTGV